MPTEFTFEEATAPIETFDWEEAQKPVKAVPFEPPRQPNRDLREGVWLPVGEETPTTPEMQQAVNIALQRIDQRWAAPREPEPTIGGLIGRGMEWINQTFKAPEEPMPPPLTPIVVPPSVEDRDILKDRIHALQYQTTGYGRSAEKLLETLATPTGAAAIPATVAAAPIMLPLWAVLGIEGSVDALKRIKESIQEGDSPKYREAVGDFTVNAPMVAGPFVHAKAGPSVLPRSLEALRQEHGIEIPPNIVQRTAEPAAAIPPKPKPERLPRGQQVVAQEPMAGEFRVKEDSVRTEIEAAEAKATAEIVEAWKAMTEAEKDNARHGRGIPQRFGGRAPDVADTMPTQSPPVAPAEPTPPAAPTIVPPPVQLPTPHTVATQKPPEQGGPDALQERQATEVLRDVPVEPKPGEQGVPTKEGAGGVPPGEPRPEETPKPAEVPLTVPDYDPSDIGARERIRQRVEQGSNREDAVRQDSADIQATRDWVKSNTGEGDVVEARDGQRYRLSGDGTWYLVEEGKETGKVLSDPSALRGGKIIQRGTKLKGDEIVIRPETPKAETEAKPTEMAGKTEAVVPPIGEGPGAKTAGAPKYPAIQQLTDQLEATPKVGTKEGLRLGEKIADAWSKKGDLWTKALGKMANAWTGAKTWHEGIRRASDLDSRLGEYDYAIQYSSAASKRAGEAIQRQMKDVTDREAAAILIDSARIATKDPSRPPGSPATPAEVRQVIKDALDVLPADTPKNVRKALERALDPSLELRQFSEQLKQYFGIREQDAVNADLFSQGLEDYYTHVWKKESNMPNSLRDAIATGRVNTYFQFARQRTIPSLIEGILEGKKPILDPAKVVPFYNFAMDRAIASRTFIKALSDIRASDGRPAVDVRGGAVIQDRADASSPVLVTPKTQAHEIADYLAINHPALQKWKWLTNTPEGRNVMMRGDMVVHPEFHEILSRFMEKSRLTAGRLMRGALTLGATAKTAKLGLLPSTFHIVHVGAHAAFHWTNPFKWAPIDFEAPATRFAIEKGHLKLAPSPAELSLFEEGIQGGLLRKIPLYGRFMGAFSDFMFHQYIPRLKLNTFENAMGRARSPLTATGRALRAGRLSENDLAARIGDASNNAFGELNQLFLGKFGRSPEMQRMLRLIFLAPDFGEARLRFASKFFSRYGDEERLAIATMMGTLYFGARLGNWLSHGNAESDDWRHAFEVKVKDEKGKNHWVGLRSVVGDVAHLIENPGQFTYVRLSPAYARPTTDFLFGRDERTGAKLSWEKKMQRVAQAWEPLSLGGLSNPDRTLLESLGTSMGLANRRDMAVNDISRKAQEWREQQGLLPIVEVIPTDEPSYLKLRTALNIGKVKDAQKILDGLKKTRTMKQIEKAMVDYLEHPYTGSNEHEKAWASTWTKQDAELYLQARKEKEAVLVDFYRLLGGTLK